ncbi:hypothetical protein SAMN04489727_1904 [Amycolatopsis tolypomycina]|uniref:Uncharacterized protein n=1 Tax=Amycolatopsis tolypomycina TaxID=208445 RepID=A0A1H4JHB7_9PSEU|nr:hypothetical protein [Amycolatopsis tolypomycina]SEB45704.1 hypothetical protein SAMN04489727_1904 [Amycolatopsis tolypomycina]
MIITFSTRVDADPCASRRAADTLGAVQRQSTTSATDIFDQRNRLAPDWVCAAADRSANTLTANGGLADQVADDASTLVTALMVFADAIDAVRARMADIRRDARAAGLPVVADVVQVTRPELSGQFSSRIAAARSAERTAHQDLIQALLHFQSFIAYAAAAPWTRTAGYVRAAGAKLSGDVRQVADLLKNDRLRTAVTGKGTEALTAAQAFARDSEISKVASQANDVLGRGFGAGALKVSYIGAALTGIGVVSSIHDGKPADKAIASGGASLVAGALATAAVASGPPGWVAIGVGAAVSMGVGYLVDHHWDNWKHGKLW